eukprot:jgi/Ulvmu1/10450/UM063_0004.1
MYYKHSQEGGSVLQGEGHAARMAASTASTASSAASFAPDQQRPVREEADLAPLTAAAPPVAVPVCTDSA